MIEISISDSKAKATWEDPKKTLVRPTESLHKSFKGDVKKLYLSIGIGIFEKNLNTKHTKRVLSIPELEYFDSIEDAIGNLYIIYFTGDDWFVSFKDGDEHINKKLKIEPINTNRVFIRYLKKYNKVCILYQGVDTNIYEISSVDLFSKTVKVKGPYSEEDLVFVDQIGDKLIFDLIVKDNTKTLLDIQSYTTYKNLIYRSYPTNINGFKKEVK